MQHQVTFYKLIEQLYLLKFIYLSMETLSSIFHTNSYITLGLPVVVMTLI